VSRLEQLQKLAAAQPGDPLTHYAIGLEMMQQERFDEALASFERTLSIDAAYSAALFQKAKAALKLGRRDAALEALRAGMEVARAKGEAHTENAMREMLETLT
jgi:tetratricopeptide (TPR) repeat protein